MSEFSAKQIFKKLDIGFKNVAQIGFKSPCVANNILLLLSAYVFKFAFY
jgi:hypothetical protein